MDPLVIAAGAAALHVAGSWSWAIRRGSRARGSPIRPSGSTTSGAASALADRREWPSVSILVPAWNERLSMRRCLELLERVDYPDRETIVIAGGPDGSYRLAKEAARSLAGVRVLEQGPRGKNAALNRGFAVARGDVIALLDADSQVEPNWLRALVAPISDRVLATTGRPVPTRPTPITGAEQMEHLAARHIERSTTLQGSGSVALARHAIGRIGGFPEQVVVGVDWDLDARLRAAGVDAAYCPDAVVGTDRPSTLREYWTNEVRWRRAHLSALVRLTSGGVLGRASALAGFYLYALAWFAAALTVVTGVAILRGEAAALAPWWLLFVLWLLLRRVSVALAVTTWSRDLRWLRLAWVPPVLLFVTLAGIIPATVTLTRASPHFRGPRHATRPDHAG